MSISGPRAVSARRRGGASYGQTDEDGHDVDQRSACGLGKTAGNTAFLKEVTEEKHT